MNIQRSPLINHLADALKSGNPLYLSSDLESGNQKLVARNAFYKVIYYRNPQYYEDQISKIALVAAAILKEQPRMTVPVSVNDPTLITCRKLLKHIQAYKIQTDAVKTLRMEITAAKVGIDSSIFAENPGFQNFAEQAVVERYLLKYGHSVHLDESGKKISILKDNALQPWSSINDEYQSWREEMKSSASQKSPPQPTWPWLYGKEGLQFKDLYDWTEFDSFITDDPAKWDKQYIFEISVCINPDSTINGNHSWFCLKTPEGKIYSAGLYRPGKPNLLEGNLINPMRVKPGYIMMPEVSEFWPFEIYTIDVAITEEAFKLVKEKTEEDKRNNDQVFQIFKQNCLLYCKTKAALAGVDIKTEEHVLELVLPESLVNRVKKLSGYLPQIVQKICLTVISFFVNLGLVVFGGLFKDKDLNAQQRKQARPVIGSPKDLFDPNTSIINHPTTFAFKTYPKVMAWRKAELEALEKAELSPEEKEAKRLKIRYGLPPSL